jgi:formylglycine-generating enzyme required for sulfatase activity
MNTQGLTRLLAATLLAAAAAATTAQAQARGAPAAKAAYMVIDLSGGSDAAKYPVSYSAEPPDLDFDTCRTKELWLRLIPAGTFMMGSPANELGRRNHETQHQVTLTQPFYIGVFEVTQKQWELVMGTNPSQHRGDTRPVDRVSYDMIRGKTAGARWPADNGVDADSFFGRLRARTALLADLPTEAQWEYACRAGTTTALNSGKNLTNAAQCPNMAEVGRYAHNRNDGKGGFTVAHTKVGMYKPNAWGLYDMHGNVFECCLDWYNGDYGAAPATDPKGAESSAESKRVWRGGGSASTHTAEKARSATRQVVLKHNEGGVHDGFRAAIQPGKSPAAAGVSGAEDEKLAAESEAFKAVWEVYTASADKIRAESQPKIDALQQQYAKALETLQGTVQRQGSLEKSKAVAAEIERFEAAKSVPPVPDANEITEIKTLQANYTRPYAAIEKDMNARLATLTQRYVQALEKLQTDLVKAGKLDEATAVSEAKERARR